jgi:hypothetical protein
MLVNVAVTVIKIVVKEKEIHGRRPKIQNQQ